MELGEYSGTPIRRLRVQNLLLTENQFPPNLRISDHAHTYPHFTIILDGSFVETYADQAFVCQRGSVLIVPQDQIHSDSVGDQGAHSISIEVSRSLERFLSSESEMLHKPQVVSTASLKPSISRIRNAFSLDPNSTHLEIHCAAMNFILAVAQATQPAKAKPSWIEEAIETIRNDRFGSASLSTLANQAGISREHFSREFRKATGQTYQAFALKCRLECAEQLLLESDIPLFLIAIECGFSDQAHFAKAFRTAYSQSPSSYRKYV